MWVLEQQPGPVNWAPNNPAPLHGMVRLWTWEALAHGAELVSYFRWRQAPFAQEQMHAGLHRPDGAAAPVLAEVKQVADEIAELKPQLGGRARVALIFSYEAQWMLRIQPQGAAIDPLRHSFGWYSALRGLALDVDVLAPGADLAGYSIIIVPALPFLGPEFVDQLAGTGARILIGCRSGSKTSDMQIPTDLPPGPLQKVLPLKVTAVESLPDFHSEPIEFEQGAITGWLEHVETSCEVRARLPAGRGIWFRNGRFDYLAGNPDAKLMAHVLGALATESGLSAVELPAGLRISRRGALGLAVNYAPEALRLPDQLAREGTLVLGERLMQPTSVAIWRNDVQTGIAGASIVAGRT
jgi:beta-galactosidase